MTKRTYKLTKAQARSATRFYDAGVTTQKALSKKLGVSKQKVANFLKAKKLGVRQPSEFFERVKALQLDEEFSWVEARKAVFYMPRWARKRAKRKGREYKPFKVFWKEWKEKWKDATQKEREEHGYDATYGDEGGFEGGTPH